MRVASFTFIVYFLILLTQPCQDVFAVAEKHSDSDTCAVQNADQGDPVSDECSPLCICGCCSLAVADHTFSPVIARQTVIMESRETLIEYNNPYTPQYLDSIWQPPKQTS